MAAGTEVEVAEETGAQAAAAATAVVDMVLRRGATAAAEVNLCAIHPFSVLSTSFVTTWRPMLRIEASVDVNFTQI
jgi:hypothetical protein